MGDMRTDRLRAAISFWALAAVALLISHDAVFAVQAGPGQGLTDALRDAGHDYWGIASALIAAVGLVVGLLAVSHIRRLLRRAQDLGAATDGVGRRRRILRTWGWLFLVVAAGFLLQENLEHLAMHRHLIGIGALAGPEYPLALPVIAGVTLLAGILGALVTGTESALVEAIASVLSGLVRRPVRVTRHVATIRLAYPSVLAHRGASRAPPEMAVLT